MGSYARMPFRLCLVCVVWLGQASWLWAQTSNEPETKEAWVISYALVILSVGLGLYVVCRPSRRNKQVKAEAK